MPRILRLRDVASGKKAYRGTVGSLEWRISMYERVKERHEGPFSPPPLDTCPRIAEPHQPRLPDRVSSSRIKAFIWLGPVGRALHSCLFPYR